MADWLALHGLEAADCLDLLSWPEPPAAPRRAADPALDCLAPWQDVCDALNMALPPAAEVLARVAVEVQVNLTPDLKRFPRPFTLHDDGRGRPYISCPVTGRTSDLLVLAHELGHACQILASRTRDMTPILRETAAYLAEALVLTSIARADPATGQILDRLHCSGTAWIKERLGKPLRHAFADLATPYSYDWNYPIARVLAERAARHLGPEAQWRIFTGETALHDLLDLPLA